MAQIRPGSPQIDREQAVRELTASLVGPPPSNDLRSLVREAGGAREVGQIVGRSARTVQRWLAGQVAHIPREARESLARSVQTQRTRDLVDRLGGAQEVAELTGRSTRTVQRWMAGQIRTPRADARRVLQRGAAATRMSINGLSIDPRTGLPASPVFMRLAGNIRAKGSSTSPSYNYDRRIGVMTDPRGERLPDHVVATIVEAISQGDSWGAHAALEEWLSTDFSAVGTYQPEAGYGMFVDRIDGVEFTQ